MMAYVYPTSSVWGIGANIFNEELTLYVHKMKNSDSSKPMSILFKNANQVKSFIPEISNFYLDLVSKFDCTVLIPQHLFEKKIPNWIIANSPLVGFRIATKESIEVFNDCSDPITTTSLNVSGEEPILSLKEAKEFISQRDTDKKLKLIFPPLYNDSFLDGKPSTIINWSEKKIVRMGMNYDEIIKNYGQVLSTK